MGILQFMSRQIGASDIAFGTGSYTYVDATGSVKTVPRVNAADLGSLNYPSLSVENLFDFYVDARAYGGGAGTQSAIVAAVSAIGGSLRTLVLAPGVWSITADLTLPANITLMVVPGALITVANGMTLRANVDAGRYQIFSLVGTGQALLNDSTGAFFPEWWGVTMDGVNASTPMQSCIDACASSGTNGGGVIELGIGTLKANCAAPYSTVSYKGQGANTTIWKANAAGPVLSIAPLTFYVAPITIEGIKFDANALSNYTLYLSHIGWFTVRDCWMEGGIQAALAIVNAISGDVDNCVIRGQGGVSRGVVGIGSDVYLPSDVTLRECKIYSAGYWGVEWNGGTALRISDCSIQDCGTVGTALSGGVYLHGLSASGGISAMLNTVYFEDCTETFITLAPNTGNNPVVLDKCMGLGGAHSYGLKVTGATYYTARDCWFANASVADFYDEAASFGKLYDCLGMNQSISSVETIQSPPPASAATAPLYGPAKQVTVGSLVFTDGDATPSVRYGNVFKALNTGATNITNFTNGVDGQYITVVAGNGNTTLKASASIILPGAVDKTLTVGQTINFVLIGAVWYSVGGDY